MEHKSVVIEAFLKSSSPRNIVMRFRMAGISVVRDHDSNAFVSNSPDAPVLARRHPQEARVSEQTKGCATTGSEEVRKMEIEYAGTM
jgi:hypothetical protein